MVLVSLEAGTSCLDSVGLFVVSETHSAASHTLMGLPWCLELIIPKVVLKVAEPQVLFSGRKGSRESGVAALFIPCIHQRDRLADIPKQQTESWKRSLPGDPGPSLGYLCQCPNDTSLFLAKISSSPPKLSQCKPLLC